jgi:hypothetical protein
MGGEDGTGAAQYKWPAVEMSETWLTIAFWLHFKCLEPMLLYFDFFFPLGTSNLISTHWSQNKLEIILGHGDELSDKVDI